MSCKKLELRTIGGNNVPVVSSLEVAEVFKKRHDNVIRDVRGLDCDDEFRLLNFEESAYINEQSRKQPMYYMTKNGFTLLVMGYNGKKAMEFKIAYIKRFDAMEKALMKQEHEAIALRARSKQQRRTFTDAIKESGENERMHGHGYKNLTDLAYRQVLGVSAKKAKELLNVPARDELRDYLTAEALKSVIVVEHIAAALLDAGLTYAEIKGRLEALSLPAKHYLTANALY